MQVGANPREGGWAATLGFTTPPRKRAHRETEASSCNPNGAKLNLNVIFNGCFNKPGDPDAMERLKEFHNYRIRRECRDHIPFLTLAAFNFRYIKLFRQWNLLPYLKLPGYYYHNLVLIFYSNARCILDEAKEEIVAIESYLMGKTFRIDPTVIANSLGLEDVGIANEDPKRHTQLGIVNTLDAHDRFLHLIITWDRHLASVQSFTYGTGLSHIFKKLEIDCSADLVVPLTDPISEKSLRKAKFTFHNGEWVCNNELPHDVPPADVEDAPQAPVAPSPPHAFSCDLIITYLDGKFASLFTHMDECFASIDHRLQAIEMRQNSMDITRKTKCKLPGTDRPWQNSKAAGTRGRKLY
ncbi:hypothetical protein V6N11_084065 [Hibiscus sabdariffa]|uniref:Uncharacterized protein n=1 Tax=Hibiscus sabdariffa TaxID=183260 RepID=A0ABR2QDD4_9ROSI